MRRIVVEWMLDVCVDQRCNVDVFLLATNIIDRFLSTIRLENALDITVIVIEFNLLHNV